MNDEWARGSASMNKTARDSLNFISFSFKSALADPMRTSLARFYQHLSLGIITKQSLFDYGRRLVSLAENFCFPRQTDSLEEVSKALIALPLPQFQNIGSHYKALSLKWEGRTEEAHALFENISEEVHPSYRARTVQSLGTTYLDKDDYASACKLFIEANRLASRDEFASPIAFLQSQLGLGILESIDGDHKSSLSRFESLRPLVEVVASRHPSMWFDYQNSLAVELMELGRLEEAEHASRIALASPFARVYPEWRETARDLAAKTRRASPSVVSLSGCSNLKPDASPATSLDSETQSPLDRSSLATDKLVLLDSIRPRGVASASHGKPQTGPPARIIDFPVKIQSSTKEDMSDDPVYLDKRYQVMVAAAETTDLELIDDMYDALVRRKGNPEID